MAASHTWQIVAGSDAFDLILNVRVDAILASLSLEERVGQMFIVDLRSNSNHPVRTVDDEVRQMIVRVAPGGVLLFGANIDTVEQTIGLVDELQALSKIPLTIAVDFEGGRVSRLTSSGKIPATTIPSSRTIGSTGDPTLAYRIGRVMGAELRALGMNMNFAPVADVFSNPSSKIGDRAFSADPEVVAAMAAAMVEGIQAEMVSSVVKHFPGHGDTDSDSHDGLATLPHGRGRLEEVEFLPFRGAIVAGADGVMTAHIVVPQIDTESIPTTFSKKLITEELRDRLGHRGLVITDSLAMRAIRNAWDSDVSAVRAIAAGADILLHPFDIDAAVFSVIDAVRSGLVPASRIEESVRRILRTKLIRGVGEPIDVDPLTVLGRTEHVKTVDDVLDAVGQLATGKQDAAQKPPR